MNIALCISTEKYEVGRMCKLYRMPVAEAIYAHWFCNRQKVGCAVERNRG